MRINSCSCSPLCGGDWSCEGMTVEDAVSPIMGVVDLDVVEDAVTNKEPIDVLPDGRTLYLLNRRITGVIVAYLPRWADVLLADTVEGISLPEEAKVYLKGQVVARYEPNDDLLELVVWEAARDQENHAVQEVIAYRGAARHRRPMASDEEQTADA